MNVFEVVDKKMPEIVRKYVDDENYAQLIDSVEDRVDELTKHECEKILEEILAKVGLSIDAESFLGKTDEEAIHSLSAFCACVLVEVYQEFVKKPFSMIAKRYISIREYRKKVKDGLNSLISEFSEERAEGLWKTLRGSYYIPIERVYRPVRKGKNTRKFAYGYFFIEMIDEIYAQLSSRMKTLQELEKRKERFVDHTQLKEEIRGIYAELGELASYRSELERIIGLKRIKEEIERELSFPVFQDVV